MENGTPSPQAIRPPWEIGTIVYHKCSIERKPGITTGWLLREAGLKCLVIWGPDLCEAHHSICELRFSHESSFE